MPHRIPFLLAAATSPLLLHAAAPAQPTTPLTTVRVASGLNEPTAVAAHPADLGRLFILQKSGQIRLLDLRTNTLQPSPFLTITPIGGGREGGLLGLAFHPNFPSNGYFFTFYNTSGHIRVVRYRAIGDPLTATAADPASADVVISIPGYSAIHFGGWIDFAPDGTLFIATGDGGPDHRSQDITDQLSGKLLRIDVDGPDDILGNDDDDAFPLDPLRRYTIPADNPFVGIEGDAEIWAYGLRNPWRDDIDPATGDLFFADVGEGGWEEINFQPSNPPGAMPGHPGYQGGRNYGWTCYEGNHPHTPFGCPPADTMVFPFYEYSSGCAIIGGLVYRGCAIPDLDGTYFFADHCSNRIFSLRYDGSAMTEFTERTAELAPGGGLQISSISAFGRDARGEVYLCDLTGGEVFKIAPAEPNDLNGDGIADTCHCPADWNADSEFNSGDISAFLTTWLAALSGDPVIADYNRDGATASGDISAFLSSWLAAIAGGC